MTSLLKSEEPGRRIRKKQKTVSIFIVFIITFTGLYKQFSFLSLIDFNYIPIEVNRTIIASNISNNDTDSASEGLSVASGLVLQGGQVVKPSGDSRNNFSNMSESLSESGGRTESTILNSIGAEKLTDQIKKVTIPSPTKATAEQAMKPIKVPPKAIAKIHEIELVQPESNHTIKESPAGITNVTDPVSEKGLAYNASSIMNGVHPLLTCSEIRNLEIIRRIGNGERKAAYMVKLPSGKHALAKRCIHKVCLNDQSVAKEASFFMKLQNQYGSEAVQFYGECNSTLPYPRLEYKDRRGFDKAASNFSLGYTSVVELGKPLITTWMKHNANTFLDKRKCFARYFTDADLEGFKFIARQYANMSSSPKLLGPESGYIDNIFAEQYILTKAGLRLGDLDSYETCKKCSYKKAVKHNCKIVSRVVFKDLKCSLANSLKNPVKFPDDHINVTKAFMNCIDGWQKDIITIQQTTNNKQRTNYKRTTTNKQTTNNNQQSNKQTTNKQQTNNKLQTTNNIQKNNKRQRTKNKQQRTITKNK